MLGVWLTTLVKDSRHAWSLACYLSEGFKAMLAVRLTTLVKDSRHAWNLVYYLGEGFKARLESGFVFGANMTETFVWAAHVSCS